MIGRKRKRIDARPEAADALRRMLLDMKYELIPMKRVLGEAVFLPEAARVSVTASPSKGMAATIDLALELQQRGFRVTPHLSARATKDHAELERYLVRLDAAGITSAFVVGGDSDEPGDFFDALALLVAMEEIGHGLTDIGIGAHPEGHPFVSDSALRQALHDKQRYAASMTTQMCFTPDTIADWLRTQREDGIHLPVVFGIPGVAELRRLLSLSARIGVGDSMRFLASNTGLVGKLVRPGGYSPDALIVGLDETLCDERAGVEGFHVYTFNEVESTERWRQEFLEWLAG
ncbi:MAG: methylenetetrahydrofolate reductase [Acidimicrobiia bacterium]